LTAAASAHRLGGHELGGHVGEHELDGLVVDDRHTELDPGPREVERQIDRSDRRAHRPRADHQPFLDEPVLRELVALPDLAEHLVRADPHVLEREDRVLEHERVHVPRRPHEGHAGQRLVDEEHRRLRRIVVDMCVDEEEVGDVTRRHVPLRAVDHPAVAVAHGRGLDHRRVGARAGLGDRVGVASLTAARRP
jgi:hypothetical protein